MNITNILKISALVLGIGVVSTPLIYQKQINKTFQIVKNELNQNHILLKEKTNQDNYTTLKREYILYIEDSKYIIKKLYPQIDPLMLQDLKTLLDNSKFLISLNFTKYPIYHKDAITLTLLSLNENIINKLNKDNPGKQLLTFIKNKGLEAFFDINNLQISKAKLKDINLKISDNQSFFNFIITNSYINLKNKDINTHISNLKFELKDEENDVFYISNLNHSMKYKNEFNYNTSLRIDTLNYRFQKNKANIKLMINKLNVFSKVESNFNKLNINNDLRLNKLQISEKTDYSNDIINIEGFRFNIEFNKIDLNSFKKLSKSIQTEEYTNIEYTLKDILNNGLNIKINPLSLKKAQLKTNIKNIDISKITFNLNTDIKHNNLTLDNINNITAYLDLNLNLITTKNNIKLLEEIMPISRFYLQNIITEKNNNIMINLSYKNQKLLSNGKQVF